MLHVSAIDAMGGASDVELVDDGGPAGVVEGHDDDVVVLKGHLPGVRIYTGICIVHYTAFTLHC